MRQSLYLGVAGVLFCTSPAAPYAVATLSASNEKGIPVCTFEQSLDMQSLIVATGDLRKLSAFVPSCTMRKRSTVRHIRFLPFDVVFTNPETGLPYIFHLLEVDGGYTFSITPFPGTNP